MHSGKGEGKKSVTFSLKKRGIISCEVHHASAEVSAHAVPHCRTACLDGIMLKGIRRVEVPVVIHRHIQMNHR